MADVGQYWRSAMVPVEFLRPVSSFCVSPLRERTWLTTMTPLAGLVRGSVLEDDILNHDMFRLLARVELLYPSLVVVRGGARARDSDFVG